MLDIPVQERSSRRARLIGGVILLALGLAGPAVAAHPRPENPVIALNGGHLDQAATLTLTKVVSGPAVAGYLMPMFHISVTCKEPADAVDTYTVDVSGNTSAAPISIPAILSVCKILELPPPSPPQGCDWQPPVYANASVLIAAGSNTATVTNAYTCKPPGTLGIDKVVVNALGVATPWPFNISYDCQKAGPFGSVAVGSGGSTIGNIPAMSICKVNENGGKPLPSIPSVAACHGASASWVTSYAPASAATSGLKVPSGGSVTVIVTNTLRCDKGYLEIKKRMGLS